MSKGFRQSQSTLHTWSGLLLGWLLFAVFVAGTAAYWREALNRWARPELARIDSTDRVVDGAVTFLTRTAPDAQSWFIPVPTPQSAGAELFWVPQVKPGDEPRGRRGRRDTRAFIGSDGQEGSARETRGGDFFYRFHFDLHYMPVFWARWIVGIAAMFMLVAIFTGIVTHKKIFRDFFTLRRGKGQRSWLDGHNATAVLALPFHLMITYTGLVTLIAMLMPWAIVANYSDESKLYAAVFPEAPAVERIGRPAPLTDLVAVLYDAERRMGGTVGYVSVFNPGDAAARITLTRSGTSMLSARSPAIAYDGVTGRMLWQAPPPGGAVETQGVMVGLHAGRFGDYPTRWLYFLCGIAGSLMVASGLVLWTVKRRERLPDPARPPFGFRVVERLNVGFVAGFPLAMTLYLWANRLLPTGLGGRADAEVNAMFAGWATIFVYALARRPARAWVELLAVQAALLIALPLYDIVALPTGLFATIAAGDWVLAGADLTFLALGAGFGFAAWRVHRFRPKARRAARSTPTIPSNLAPAE
ncbi:MULTISPECIES: PepSY-associated TM helix domain-containing protein [unclassified Sphingomonas]|uniref:PepSY-associated TM helix domain-containing protein n=1 Tax=unclassified Sphingomonas TaxID=196159 RepID=UPI0006FE19E9|nr:MULTISPECIES: PepSY-associated TM helix domain-containing protein [unclassified Sphingomonas]KQM27276.1 peptidase [Sphingomonas sp. Leaf9]KQM43613.1 peptidase [Sphingomonas sp. Leaf11]